ncbi:MAG: tetratricopeptide repeat protein [Spirochaetia bacterium]
MVNTHEQSPKEKLIQALSSGIYKHRFLLIGLFVFMVVFFIVFGVYSELQKSRSQEAAEHIEAVNEQFITWIDTTDEDEKTAIAEEIFESTESILETYPNTFAAQKAMFIQANLDFNQENYEEAITGFTQLIDRYPETYLAPIAQFNIAAAYENLEEADNAIAAFESLLADFPQAVAQNTRALMNVGRLHESQEEWEEAEIAYTRLIDGYPESHWTNIAENRIIYLTVSGYIDQE